MDSECPVCMEVYGVPDTEPRVLVECGHSICGRCVDRIHHEDGTIVCPECRAINVGHSMPRNFLAMELLQQQRRRRTPSPSFTTAAALLSRVMLDAGPMADFRTSLWQHALMPGLCNGSLAADPLQWSAGRLHAMEDLIVASVRQHVTVYGEDAERQDPRLWSQMRDIERGASASTLIDIIRCLVSPSGSPLPKSPPPAATDTCPGPDMHQRRHPKPSGVPPCRKRLLGVSDATLSRHVRSR